MGHPHTTVPYNSSPLLFCGTKSNIFGGNTPKNLPLDIFIHKKTSLNSGDCEELESRRGVIRPLIEARLSSQGINTTLKQRGINNEARRHGPSEDDARGWEAAIERCRQAKT